VAAERLDDLAPDAVRPDAVRPAAARPDPDFVIGDVVMLDMAGAGKTLFKYDACHASVLKVTKKGLVCTLLNGSSIGINKTFRYENVSLLEGSSFRQAKAAGRQLAAARQQPVARSEAEEEEVQKPKTPQTKVMSKSEAAAFSREMFRDSDEEEDALAG